MSNKLLAKVLKDKNLEIATEIREKLEPNTEYEIIFSEDEIIFKKVISLEKKTSSLLREGSGKSILRHAGTWKGDDFQECLKTVYDNRSQIEI